MPNFDPAQLELLERMRQQSSGSASGMPEPDPEEEDPASLAPSQPGL